MIYLDDKADTFPDGLKGTPFDIVYKALRKVASDVWAVDPTVYRAGMGWGWSALQTPEDLEKFRGIVINALISAFAPLVKDSQTNAELVEYLRQWREYTPTFPRLQALYALFGVTADIQPISDPESQNVIPVTDTIHAFYVRITPADMARLLTLSEAYKIAVGASPLGSRPYVYYALESDIDTMVSPAPVDEASTVFVVNDEIATDPPEPPVPPVVETPDYYILDDTTGAVLHSINSPLSGAKPSTVTITGNIEHIDNPSLPQMEILLGIRWDSSYWGAHAFNYDPSGNQWWSGVLSEEDRQRLADFGLSVSKVNTGAAGQIGAIVWDNNYTFEPLAFYADLTGTQENQFDLSKFTCIQQTRTDPNGYSVTFMMVWYDGYSSTLNTTWRCRITKLS